MRSGKLLLIACGGLIFAWLTNVTVLRDSDEPPRASIDARPQADLIAGSTTTQRPLEIPLLPESEPLADEPIARDAAATDFPQEPIIGSNGSAIADSIGGVASSAPAEASIEPPVWVPSQNEKSPTNAGNTPSVFFEEPFGGLPELANVLTITCEFGAGRSGGVRSAPIGTAEYQGGPLVFDSVNLDAGTAIMRGSIGATGSWTGETEVRTDATPNGIHFSGVTPAGNFVLVTAFGLADGSGGYVALMSRHNERPLGLHSSVFSGTCY